ncbi:nucleotidyltransferase family protein [Salinisphaera orenii]|uniref:nucleotidyltransferase family protein n=1 Tax=Salinisphaera orenii TaxID=856731 RepID=UPI00296F8DC8
MILAAGRGERLRPETDTVPKPLLTIGGQSLIETQIRALVAAGVRQLVINVAYRGSQIRAALGDGSAYGADIVYSEETPTALDTGGGVCAALPLLGKAPFLVVAADIWTDFDLRALAVDHSGSPELVFVPNPDHRPAGDYGVAHGRVDPAGPRMTYAGIGRFDPAMFEGFTERRFGLSQVIDNTLAHRTVYARIHRGAWQDLGRPHDLERARRLWGDRDA